ncbi:hypothetical protein BGZ96_003973 [Linnemannia gamsii]|uniref:Uncharacterized protein n=1 Tax=Linnemannia gamsii TaxID=64522 RepID=A0ABQ7JIM1_9FUNG|nr:hypothetical protein BGZ96_003973 [Linnemannia gamsii]
MKFATTSIIAAAVLALGASATKPTSSVVTVTLPGSNSTASPTESATSSSSGISTATETATITVPIITTITIGVPTVISTTVMPSGTPSPGGGNAGNAIQAPVKAMMAIGGVAALAQFF